MSVGRVYTVALDGLTVTNDSSQDVWEMVNGAGVACVLLGFELYSATTSDERVKLTLLRRSTTGSAGSAATENPLDGGNTVTAGCAVNTLVTTQGTAGAVLAGWQWSQLSPLIYLPTPEEQIVIPPSGRLALALGTAVAASRTWSGSLRWMEVG
jgi:hypothetical protein